MRSDRQTDGRTDTTKLIVAFRNFANAPKNNMRKHMQNFCNCNSLRQIINDIISNQKEYEKAGRQEKLHNEMQDTRTRNLLMTSPAT